MRVFWAIQGRPIARQIFVPAKSVTTTQTSQTRRQRGVFSTFFPFALTVLREADLIGTNRPRSTLTKPSHFSPTKSSSKSPNKMPAAEELRPVLQFAKLSEDAKAPTRGSTNAAGYDLYSAVEVVVPAKGKNIVNTDIQIAVPDGCYGRVAPRSGLAVKSFIDVGAGVIDHDYRGNVGVVMFNFSDKDFEVKKGDRIAQLICEKIFYPELEELPNLSKTARGSDGYGSTGTK